MKKTSKFIAAMAVALTVAAPIAANAATSATGAYWASGGRITQYNTGGYAEHTGSVIKSVRSTSYGSVTNRGTATIRVK